MALSETLTPYLNIYGMIWSFLTLITILLTYTTLLTHYASPLRHFPGPFLASITRLWLVYHSWLGDENEILLKLHRKHGPVLRVSPSMLLVSDATKLPDIYARYTDKTDFYVSNLLGSQETLLNVRGYQDHVKHKRLVAGAYKWSNVKQMESVLDARLQEWIGELDTRFASTGQEFDFVDWAEYIAYDCMTEVVYGESIGFVKADEDKADIVKSVHDIVPVFGVMGRLGPLTTWLQKTPPGKIYLVSRPEHRTGAGALMRFRDRLFQKRKQKLANGEAADKKDFLQGFLNLRDENGKPLPDDLIKNDLQIALLAGTGSVSMQYQGLVHNVMSNNDVHRKLMQEIENADIAGKLSPIATCNEVRENCPYYIACVKETLRLDAFSSTFLPRHVGRAGLLLQGKYVPEGTEVAANPWLISRDTAVFGEDADVFRPERWLESPEKVKLMERYGLWFGYLDRECIGKSFAMLSLYKGPLMFFRTFAPSFVDKRRTGTWIVRGGIGGWLDMPVQICRRNVVA